MKTAVEFLIEQITDSTMSIREAFKQAKEMEKQQIIEAHGNKLITPKTSDCAYWRGGEEYYNKTFKPE
jgi:hypothetical protein